MHLSFGLFFVDGKPLSAIGVDSWRRQIGSVMQDDFLFAGTLAENIAFFDPEPDMDRVMECARLAAVDEEIEAMPMRYDTLVGDMGSTLSGGQRQRVLLARALYPDPSVLFIDEGTAHLDPKSERQVMEALCALPITRIVSSHRPLPVQAAQKVYMVRKTVTRLEVSGTSLATDAAADCKGPILAGGPPPIQGHR